jgi:hypothetical protein
VKAVLCAGFRMPASEGRAASIGGRRPKAAKERTRGVLGTDSAAGAMGI